MNPPADIIRRLLIDSDLGSDGGGSEDWPVFVGFFPGKPDEALCVYDTAGRFDGRIMATGERIEHPGIMIMVRGKDYPAVWVKANEIALMLDVQRHISIAMSAEDRYTLHNVSRSGAIMPLGVEEEGDRRRHLFTINSTVTIGRIPPAVGITTQGGDQLVTHDGVLILTQ